MEEGQHERTVCPDSEHVSENVEFVVVHKPYECSSKLGHPNCLVRAVYFLIFPQ